MQTITVKKSFNQLILTLLLMLSCFFISTTNLNAQSGPIMKFETTDIDYGSIPKGSEPDRKFKVTNVGDAPLVISNAQGSCGCTVPTWPKEPIAPGATATINVRYDTQRVGPFTKYITLTTNGIGQDTFRLTIHGTVLQAD